MQRNVWAFDIQSDGSVNGKRLLIHFPDYGLDGMRCDVDGNLYITRHGKGTVAIVSAAGKLLRKIDVLGKHPTNVCFGGKDGRTCYVTEAEKGRIVQFRTERPGLEWQRPEIRTVKRGIVRAPSRPVQRLAPVPSGALTEPSLYSIGSASRSCS